MLTPEEYEKLFGKPGDPYEHIREMQDRAKGLEDMITKAQNLSDQWIKHGGISAAHGQALRQVLLPMHNQEVIENFMKELDEL